MGVTRRSARQEGELTDAALPLTSGRRLQAGPEREVLSSYHRSVI